MDIVSVIIPIIAIVGGISVAIVSIISKGKVREMLIRERIAMIEKGLVPPPEVDPAGFDRAMGPKGPSRHSPGRHRRTGITLMGVGFGLMVLLALNGDTLRRGVGAGGFLVILGLAFLINGLFEREPDQPTPLPPGSPDAPTPLRK